MKKDNKNIKHVWSVLCEKSVIDSETNNMSLTNLLEEIQIKPPEDAKIGDDIYSQEKNVKMPFELITLWRKDFEGLVKTEIRIDLLDPSDKVLASAIHPIEIASNLSRLRFRNRFDGIKVVGPGEYTFIINLKKGNDFEPVGKAALFVKIEIPRKK